MGDREAAGHGEETGAATLDGKKEENGVSTSTREARGSP